MRLINSWFLVYFSSCPVRRRVLEDADSLTAITYSPKVTLGRYIGFSMITIKYDVRIISLSTNIKSPSALTTLNFTRHCGYFLSCKGMEDVLYHLLTSYVLVKRELLSLFILLCSLTSWFILLSHPVS